MDSLGSSVRRDLSVMVVDDAVVYRKLLRDVLAEIPGVKVVGTAANGRLAVSKMEVTATDFVVLDVEMPELSGLEALDVIRRRWPGVGVLLVSGSSRSAADLTLEARSRGALGFFPKPNAADADQNRAYLRQRLTSVLGAFSAQWNSRQAQGSPDEVRRWRRPREGSWLSSPSPLSMSGLRDSSLVETHESGMVYPFSDRGGAPVLTTTILAPRRSRIEVVAIGASTGGPQALGQVIPALPSDLGVPVLIVQHMPPVFTSSLVRTLAGRSRLPVREASDGDLLEPNVVLIAPGGLHMVVGPGETDGGAPRRRVLLTDAPPENSCRPAVDVLFRSLASVYRGKTLAVIMTGMGQDGVRGVGCLKAGGCYCMTQDDQSCAVYGMPRAVDLAALSDERVPLDLLATRITAVVRDPR